MCRSFVPGSILVLGIVHQLRCSLWSIVCERVTHVVCVCLCGVVVVVVVVCVCVSVSVHVYVFELYHFKTN